MKIEGIIEEIIFHNEENGYTVAKVECNKETVTAVGCLPYISEEQNLILEGEWVTHPQFGKQFKINSFEEVLPDTKHGILKYLSSGVISGIGAVTAKKIVDKFGEQTFDVMDNNINRLYELDGIGEKKVKIICESYSKQRELKNIMIFLQNYGVTPNQCVKIYKRFGNNSINTVKENPYILTEEISGIGFKIADKIALNLGVEKTSPFRIQSGIRYVVNEFCALGNTYMPMDKLIKEASEILGTNNEEIEKNVYESAVDGKIKVEKIEDIDCVFTIPYYYCELGVTKNVLNLSLQKFEKIKIKIDTEIKNFESKNKIEFAELQKKAIVGAFENGIEVITGGPGTGKTTIINCIAEIFENNGMKVFMAAPTGRAAKRMTEATGREAKTIHRLLELGYGEEDDAIFFKNEETPLQCDVLIVDEASMIDIMLMNSLMKAIGSGTRLIIVGDVDQLPSVGPGNVLKDIIESHCVSVFRLADIFRQKRESMIVINAHKINKGEMPVLNEKGKDFFFIKCEETSQMVSTVISLINYRLPKYNENWDKLKDIQILSPMRKGTLGVENLNKQLQEILNPPSKNKIEKEYRNSIFRLGDKVMQIKNNYSLKWIRVSGNGEDQGLGVFNGDVGYITGIDKENGTITVLYDDEREIEYDNIYLDELELAYAITIHKSQGSEFPVIIMPVFMGSPLLMNRNLLYTAITRSKKLVVLVGSAKAINFMVNNNRSFERYSSLKWRITQVTQNFQ